jgi:DNA integrity scanning protein DisA with diadenylate cyclase activity
MNANKITVPANVANAIAHYVALADTKTEALQDILRLGYEAERSEIILRHFEHDYDELMEALICGYEVEKTPEDHVRQYYERLGELRDMAKKNEDEYYFAGQRFAVDMTLDLLGIKIAGVNA